MEALTWTGNIGGLLNPILGISLVFLLVAIMLQLISGLFIPAARGFDANGSLIKHPFTAKINLAVLISFCVLIGISSLYLSCWSNFWLRGWRYHRWYFQTAHPRMVNTIFNLWFFSCI